MPRLFHVSEDGPVEEFSPRPSPPGSPYEGERLVWAVDETHLANYLLPRDCPRVCWLALSGRDPLLASPAPRVIAIEHAWADRLAPIALYVHELLGRDFESIDAIAGYWVSRATACVREVRVVENCLTALAEHDAELRIAPTLWPYIDAVTESATDFSVIQARNAQPRPAR